MEIQVTKIHGRHRWHTSFCLLTFQSQSLEFSQFSEETKILIVSEKEDPCDIKDFVHTIQEARRDSFCINMIIQDDKCTNNYNDFTRCTELKLSASCNQSSKRKQILETTVKTSNIIQILKKLSKWHGVNLVLPLLSY